MPPTKRMVRNLVIAAALALIGFVLFRTQGFGAFSIRNESYYPEVVKRITTDGAFVKTLGSPITVDASGVVCDQKTFDAAGITGTASCYLPVSGPKGSGNVHAQIFKRPGALDVDFFLHIGDKVIKGT